MPRSLPPRRPLTALLLAATTVWVGACTATPRPEGPALPTDPGTRAAVVAAAQRGLTERCLAARGLDLPDRSARDGGSARDDRLTEAVFGAGEPELSLALPTGYTARAHTDGCLAAAQRRLYGDQRRWFRVSTLVNNLRPAAARRSEDGSASADATPAPGGHGVDFAAGVRRERELAELRREHRAEIADHQRLRTRALRRAAAWVAAHPRESAAGSASAAPPKGTPAP